MPMEKDPASISRERSLSPNVSRVLELARLAIDMAKLRELASRRGIAARLSAVWEHSKNTRLDGAKADEKPVPVRGQRVTHREQVIAADGQVRTPKGVDITVYRFDLPFIDEPDPAVVALRKKHSK